MADYYKDEDMKRLPEIAGDTPELTHRFFEYYNEVLQEGSLSKREKVLIGLAVSHAIQCPYCIDSFTRHSKEAGTNRQEMTEAVHVAAAVAAGATISHTLQMLNVLDREEGETATAT